MLLHSIHRKSLKKHTMVLVLAIVGVFFSQSLSAQNDLWIPKPDLGDGSSGLKRTGAVSFTINGKVYIGLGKDGSTYHQDLWVYDTIAETWTQKADFVGIGRIGAFSMVMNNKAIVGTGEIAGGSRTNTVYKYEAGPNTWTAVANFSGGVRSYSSAFSIGTRGFVVGGDDGAFQNDLWEYDINGNNWIGRQAFPGTARMKAVAFTIGSNAYYGTGDIGAGTVSQDFWEYNIVTNSWTQLADFPGVARAGAIGCSNGTNGYLGLGNDGGFLFDFWSFDGTNWTQQSDFTASARELAVATMAGNKVYAGTGFGNNYYKDFFQWDPCAVPQITVHPVGLDVCEGIDVSFTVEISNTGSETYEWLLDGTPVPGGTNATLDIAAVTEAEEGSYTCKITNACGTSVSDAAILNVTPLPLNAPTGLLATPDTLCPDNTFDITLTADNNGNNQDTLRWYSNGCGGDLIGSAFPVNNEVQVTPPSPPTSIEYYARWENQCGETECDTVFVFAKEEAIEPTSIATTIDTICNNYNDSLFLSVTGGSGDYVAWYIGDVCDNPSAPLVDTGMTIELLTLGQIPTTTTTYSARWETYCGNSEFHSTCLMVDVVVNGDFSIYQQPQNKSVCEGTDTVMFQIGVNEGGSLTDIFYQWFFEGNAITGAQSDTLLVLDILPADSGNYYCKVYNTCDTIISDSAFLNVSLNPTIIVEPVILDTICEGDSLTFTMQALGSEVLQYQWHFNNVPTSTIDTFYTINPAGFTNTGDYYCVVTNGCGVDTTDVVSVEVDTIPFVTLQPTDQIVCLNGTAQFETNYNGSMPISYQWYKIVGAGPSIIMPGETGSLLEISPVQEADTTFDYFCLANNECFDGISTDTVSLDMFPQIEIMDSISSDTNNVCNTYPNYIELTVYGGEGDTIRWFTGSCDGTEIAATIDTTLDVVVPAESTTFYARWENACGISACDSIRITVAQDPEVMDTLYFEDNNICYNAYDSILLTAVGGNGDSIRWFDSYNCNGQPFAVTADTFVYVTDIPLNSTTYAAQYKNACGESACLTVNLYIDDLTYIADQTEFLEVCEEGSSFMYVEAGGTEPFNYQWYQNGSELAGEINDILYVGPVSFADTGQYYCQVWTDCDTAVSDSIPLYMLELPYFTQQPMDTAVCEGTRDTIQIKVAGDMPILIQWYKNGTEIGGSSLLDTLLILDPVYETADYFAMISNGCGIAYSDTITHRAFDTLIINQQPQYQNLCLLDTAEFSVSVESTEFVSYTWQKLGETGSYGNDSILRIPNLDYDDQGQYFCIISDTCGELSSDTAMLNMNTPPQVVTDPFGATVCEGTFFQFEAVFNADADSLTYEWNYNGGWLPNTDTNILVFDPVQRGDEGTYYIRAFNNCGEDESVPVQLNVDYLPNLLEALDVIPDTICPECDYDSLTLIAIGDGGGYGDYIEWYEGQVGDDYIIGVGDTLLIPLPTATTEYFARWVNDCSDANGTGTGGGNGGGTCEALSITVVYQGNPEPPTNVEVNVNDFCVINGDSIVLSGDGGYGDILKWYIIDEPDEIYIGRGESLTVPQPMDTTLYAAKWTNHCGNSDSIVIQVNVVALPEAIIVEADSICAGQAYEIENVFVDHYDSLFWATNHPNGYYDTNNIKYPIYYNDMISLIDTSYQDLVLTAYGQADCPDTYDTINLVTFPLPPIAITPELPAICRDSIIEITAIGANEFYFIDPDDPLTQIEENPVYLSPVETKTYYLVGTSERGCIDSLDFNVDVYPTPLVDLGDSVFLFSCEPVQLDAGGGDGSEYYIWSNGYRTRSITVYETGNYSVIVGNPGCEVNDTGYISLCSGRIFMPTAFTPNQDGINEKFKPVTADPSLEFRMTIFDRWGQLMFETYDIHEGWDGNFDGEPCPTGNYVWRIDYQGQGTNSPGKKGSDVGTVMLVR